MMATPILRITPLAPLRLRGGWGGYVFALFLLLALASCAEKPGYPEAREEGGEVRLSISAMAEGVPYFYSFSHGGRRIDYIVLRVKGRVESYFDACAKCAPKKLGYRVEGDRLACVACGQRYPLDDLRGVGSCYPVPLPGHVDGESYAINLSDILTGERYF